MGEIDVTKSTVEFLGDKGPLHCMQVHHMMTSHGMPFLEAVDYLELRRDYHWRVIDES